MLSFIYWLTRNFENAHEQKPNVLYINRFHFEHLRQEFANPNDLDAMMRMLGMTITITEEAVNPHLARLEAGEDSLLRRRSAAGGGD